MRQLHRIRQKKTYESISHLSNQQYKSRLQMLKGHAPLVLSQCFVILHSRHLLVLCGHLEFSFLHLTISLLMPSIMFTTIMWYFTFCYRLAQTIYLSTVPDVINTFIALAFIVSATTDISIKITQTMSDHISWQIMLWFRKENVEDRRLSFMSRLSR